ncbi:hypothetical protein BgiMline_036163, partial [Biomphalaria glabrata]
MRATAPKSPANDHIKCFLATDGTKILVLCLTRYTLSYINSPRIEMLTGGGRAGWARRCTIGGKGEGVGGMSTRQERNWR